jgi:hypothetical protein
MGNLKTRVAKLEAKKGKGVAVVNMMKYRGLSYEEAKEQHLRENPQDAGAELWIILRDILAEKQKRAEDKVTEPSEETEPLSDA